MGTKRKKIFAILLSVAVLAGLLGVGTARAIEYGMLGGKPAYPDEKIPDSQSWFIYNLSPGESKEDGVEVMNLFPESWEALIYAADTTRSSSGGFALKQFSEPKDEVGSWVKFYPDDPPAKFQNIFKKKGGKIIPFCGMSRDDLLKESGSKTMTDEDFSVFEKWCQGEESVRRVLNPKERTIIPFVSRVPDNADVGEHTGGILIQKVQPDDAGVSDGSAVKLTTRVGVRIYETVPGEIIKKLALEDFKVVKNFKEFDFGNWFRKEKKPEEYLVQSKIRNDGNASIEQENKIIVKDLLFGKRNAEIPRSFQVLKNDYFISNYSWSNPRFGKFSFATEAKYSDSNGQEQALRSQTVSLWIIPWREIATAAVLLLLATGICWWWKRRMRQKYGGVGWIGYKVKKSDNIHKLAEKSGVDWIVLAKTNKIKAPYLLAPGQIILAPAVLSKGKKKIIPKKNQKDAERQLVKDGKNSRWILWLNPLRRAVENIRRGKRIALLLWGLIIAALTIAAIIFFTGKSETVVKKIIPISSPSTTKPSSPNNIEVGADSSASPEISLEKLDVDVLNATDISGSAAKIGNILKENGLSEVEAKNAESRDYRGVTVYFKDGFEKAAQKTKELLSVQYENIEIKKGFSSETTSGDIVIILGN